MSSASLQRLMRGWQVPANQEIVSVPVNNSLSALIVSRLTPQQLVNYMRVNRGVPNSIKRAAEARLNNLTRRGVHRANMGYFARLYRERKKRRQNAKTSKKRNIARRVGRKWLSKTKK